MWPGKGEALSRTVEAEEAIRELYLETIRRWAPAARAAVLPALTAAVLPPDPDAVAQTQSVWDEHSAEIVLAGLGVLWAVTAYETATGLGQEIADTVTPKVSTVVLGIVLASVVLHKKDVLAAVSYVESTPELKASRDAFLEAAMPDIAATPGRVQAKITAALAEPALTMSVIPDDRPQVLRTRASEVLAADSPELDEVATTEGYQAAGVLNHAVMATAKASEYADELQKVFICTLDSKTRPTHWAADGQRVPLDGFFTVGGEQLAYPGDETASPKEWRNCRCRMGILAHDEPLPDEVDRHTERLDGRDSVVINRDGRTQAEEIQRRKDAGNTRARDEPDGIGRVAAAAPNEQETAMAKTATLATEDTADDTETYLTFTDALFAVTGVPTSDGRMLSSDIKLSFRDTPLPLQWCKENEGGHYGSVTVGVIESLSYKKGEVRASGYMLNNDDALEAIDLVSHGVSNPSVDLADCRIIYSDVDGVEVSEDNYFEGMDVYSTVTEAEVIATTLVATPAFGETRIALNEQRESRAKSLVASAAEKFRPRVYDPALFADPKLTGPTHLTITEDGHIFGHIACWDEKHRSVQLNGMKPPRSKTGYRNFHTSPPVHLSDGSQLPVGRLTVGTGHANTAWDAGPALEHYDNTGTCFALVHAYEDKFGIAVSGVAAPWATPEQVEMGLSAPLSGDWRWIDNNYELVAALAVNTPGFVVRTRTGASGAPKSMVASLGPSPRVRDGGIGHLSLDVIKAAVREGVAEERRAWELAERRKAAEARLSASVGDLPTARDRAVEALARI